MTRLALAIALLAALLQPAAAEDLASRTFGAVAAPSPSPARAVGSYSRGCIAGAAPLAIDGPHWQVMRASRNRNWGHPALVALVEDLGVSAAALGLGGVLVGDLSQPRGGPMPYGHASHQIGLDADIWFQPMPEPRFTEAERESLPFRTVLNAAASDVDPARFTPAYAALLERAAKDARVERIFVHPLIKKTMCAATEGAPSRDWLGKIRPWYGHHEHFHVRMGCPASSKACQRQAPPPKGDGCGEALAYWFTPAPYTPDPKAKPKPPLTMAGMPRICRLLAEAGHVARPRPRPFLDQAAVPTPAGQATPVPPSPQ
ncbi:penicillin-insensitive murein endopeptidase [Acuticoccus kandeliae]|uniref:penicillin-insensitive murein endopeptidase n=1 Tax=Acuticoccus kandeliae TaxID=2073160 RepID=UPI001FEA2064|nr:penicillin-insensitive murein endopeptidase [Acuticoccus kandeliae]